MPVCRCTSCFTVLATVEEFIAHKPGCVADAIAFQAALRSSSSVGLPPARSVSPPVLDDPARPGSRPPLASGRATSGELS